MLALADIFSILNALFGFSSIALAVKGNYWMAGNLILLAVLSDGLDGLLARKFHSGRLGENIDSLADIISFCIAPSTLIIVKYDSLIVLFTLSIYLLASLLRLSSFSILKRDEYFNGLPIPAVGMILILIIFLGFNPFILSVVLLFLSILMVSKIRYPKVNNKMGLIAFILIILVIILRDNFYYIAPLALLFALFTYVLVGPAYMKYF